MKHFEFELTPAKAYDLSLFFQIIDQPIPDFLNTQLAKFYEMAPYEQTQARLEARKGRLIIGSNSVFDTSKAFLLLNDYVKRKKLEKIAIFYHYKPIHSKQMFLEWLKNVIKVGFGTNENVSIDHENPNASIQVYTNHNINWFDVISNFNPQYFIHCGTKRLLSVNCELINIPLMVEYYTSVEFSDDFGNVDSLKNYVLDYNPLMYDSKETKFTWLYSSINNYDIYKQNIIMKLLGIERI